MLKPTDQLKLAIIFAHMSIKNCYCYFDITFPKNKLQNIVFNTRKAKYIQNDDV